ncbi:hypothetical protein KVR01_007648 [Diaporthe batatas]|uniref:uncharacterized protein n=1 Tax=Diaporthe batatas TaxID=748121 RepID=UPI001D03AC01|nr:uncharacterized protein KVR01_007648 [Diaporthe batatas]KAG8163170.1 hypothetical protein KVR01_007648 [Diaporthe batatas]
MSAPDHPPSPPTSRGTIPKPSPGGPGATANQLMDHLQKQLKDGEGPSGSGSGDTASVASGQSTTSSSGRRRRRRNKNALARQAASGNTTNLTGPGGAHSLLGLNGNGGGSSGIGPMVPKPAGSGDGKTPKLKIDLNLEANLELKAHLKGDLCLSLVVEEKYSDRASAEVKMPREGGHVTTELFYMRVGRLRFRRTWVDERAFMRGQFFLTALSAAALLLAGFLAGLSASGYVHARQQQQQQFYAGGGLGLGLVVSSSVSPPSSASSWSVEGDGVDLCGCNIHTALGAVGNTTLLG